MARVIPLLAGLVKKRHNKLSLTKPAEKILDNDNVLFRKIFNDYCTRFNWAFFDLYGENGIGQTGFGFSLLLLSKYGNKKRSDMFYADKYFMAYPELKTDLPPTRYGYFFNDSENCYSLRTFERFMNFFGLVNIDRKKWDTPIYISKTGLFDRIIKCRPHKE